MMSDYEIKIVPIGSLKQHEEVIACHLARLMEQIKNDGFLSDPVIVDRNTMVILDGHHRFNSLMAMGLKFCPVCLVDYQDETIQVASWKEDMIVTKDDVIGAGMTGELLSPKTSRHLIPDRPVGMCFLLRELG